MKIIFSLFILFCSSSVFAEDISDFQIEGLSIGDSLLDYFSEDFIKKNTDDNFYSYLKDPHRYKELYLVDYGDQRNYHLDNYHVLRILYKKQISNYIIHGIAGQIVYEKKSHICNSERNKIINEFEQMFINLEKQGPNVESHIYDKTGKSKVDNISFWFDNNDVVLVSCYYWSDEIDYFDNLKIQLFRDDVNLWLIGE